jgi:uncharacterized membrane protein HdeD (DUF308 family)
MLFGLTQNWWALVVRGIAAILFGILAFARPGITLVALIIIFAAYAIIDGIFAIAAAINASRAEERWWALLLEGLCGIIAGTLAFVLPGITAVFFLYVIAFWALATGIFELITAVRLRKVISDDWLMAFSGIVSVLFGALLLIAPGAGALALIWWIGAYAFVFGILLLLFGIRLRRAKETMRGTV